MQAVQWIGGAKGMLWNKYPTKLMVVAPIVVSMEPLDVCLYGAWTMACFVPRADSNDSIHTQKWKKFVCAMSGKNKK